MSESDHFVGRCSCHHLPIVKKKKGRVCVCVCVCVSLCVCELVCVCHIGCIIYACSMCVYFVNVCVWEKLWVCVGVCVYDTWYMIHTHTHTYNTHTHTNTHRHLISLTVQAGHTAPSHALSKFSASCGQKVKTKSSEAACTEECSKFRAGTKER